MKHRGHSQDTSKKRGKRRVVITERTEITTEPKLEIRKPATLAQALTEPAVVVEKPETKARVVRRSIRRAV